MKEHRGEREAPHIEPVDGVFTDLFRAERKPPRWVIKDLLPVGLTILGGPPKSMKSTIELAMALTVAGLDCKALPFHRLVGPKSRVMGWSSEADAGELRDTAESGMKVHGVANGRILIADDPWLFRLDEEDGVDKLMYWLNKKRPRFAFMDPLSDFHALDENNPIALLGMLRPIRQWAVRHDAAFMFVHHARKKGAAGNGRPQENAGIFTAEDLRGSGAIFGKADAVLMASPIGNTEGSIHLAAKFKRGPAWDMQIDLPIWGKNDGGQGKVRLTTMDRWVWQTMRKKLFRNVPIIEVARQLKMRKARVLECLKVLVSAGMMKKKGRRWIALKRKKHEGKASGETNTRTADGTKGRADEGRSERRRIQQHHERSR